MRAVPGRDGHLLGSWEPSERRTADRDGPVDPTEALPPEQVADLVAWIYAAPTGLLLNQVTVTPLLEQGWRES